MAYLINSVVNVRDQAAALQEDMKEKDAEFVASGAEIYQGNVPEGVSREH